MMKRYWENLYRRTMEEAYHLASLEIAQALADGGSCLDCGAGGGHWFDRLADHINMEKENYFGIEWNSELVDQARGRGLNVIRGSLNEELPFESGKFACVFALSVLEHLINGCRFMIECHRVLRKRGTLVILTPNISTYFTLFLILLGKMPSTGPHPDSSVLIESEEIVKVSSDSIIPDPESQTPVYRHLIVYSFRVLKSFLRTAGFSDVMGRGFGVYPFPNFMQPFLEKVDPYHCHQMVFVARKE
jgi:SAM-dependent methyltransferase